MQEKWYREPLIRTQLDYIKKQLMSDVNWLNKASWKLNKTLKGIFFLQDLISGSIDSCTTNQ